MTQPAFDFGDEALDDPANPTLTVGELADAVNQALRRSFSNGVWVRGEITGWNERGGHAYFQLADDSPGRQAVVRVQFFATARQRMRPLLAKHRLRLADGMKVRIFGHLDFYGPGGTLGLKLVSLDPRFTLGDLAQQRDQVLRRLVADGALDANRRHPLSPVPLRVGVVTSAGTAAWHDFHDELERCGFGFRIVLADTRVQGPEAARRVARAVLALSQQAVREADGPGGLDVIVVIRGGGSRNDLATFDAEPIARAIAAAPVPVLAGLGHEIDRSVADEVAHTSLKTPTACAAHLVQAVRRYLTDVEQRFATITEVCSARLTRSEQQLGERAQRIVRRTQAAVDRADERLAERATRLRSGAPRPLIECELHLQRCARQIPTRVAQLLVGELRQLEAVEGRVRALDPVNVLARGWTITRRADGRVVRRPDELDVDDVLITQFAAGTSRSRVVPSGGDES
ncbi:MAG: exodeoxyribonuclease VII large subunit [Ilumatobacteraceae bacterium]